jgi:hypothetical protein
MTDAGNIDRRDFSSKRRPASLSLTLSADPSSIVGEAAADTPLA